MEAPRFGRRGVSGTAAVRVSSASHVTVLVETSVVIDYLNGDVRAAVVLERGREAAPLHAGEITQLEVGAGMRLQRSDLGGAWCQVVTRSASEMALAPPWPGWPPSTGISATVMYAAAAESRNVTSAATSSGWPARLSGVWDRLAARNAGDADAVIGVSMNPGWIDGRGGTTVLRTEQHPGPEDSAPEQFCAHCQFATAPSAGDAG